MEPYQSSISWSAMEKIRNWQNQQRAAGRKVEPWQVEAMYKAALSSEADRASSNYARNRELGLRERQLTADEAYREKQLEAQKESNIGGMLTTGVMLNYMMKDKETGLTPLGGLWQDVKGGGFDTLKTGGSNLWKYLNKPFEDTAAKVAAGTQTTGITPTLGEAAYADQYGFADTAMETAPMTSWTDYIAPVGGGFLGENIARKTGLSGWAGEHLPGGEKEWEKAAGAGTAAGIAALSGADPLTAGVTYLAASLGFDKLFG